MNDKIKHLLATAYKTDSIARNKWRIENREQLRQQRKKELKELMEKDKNSIEWLEYIVNAMIKNGGDGDLLAVLEHIKQAKERHKEETTITENTSDGYHTFKELYGIREAYNVALFNEWGSQRIVEKKVGGAIIETIGKYNIHKSWKHHDGELCFGGGWFIVVAVLPTGQISNHYKEEDWDLFQIPETEKALFLFDGHTTQDVIERLLKL